VTKISRNLQKIHLNQILVAFFAQHVAFEELLIDFARSQWTHYRIGISYFTVNMPYSYIVTYLLTTLHQWRPVAILSLLIKLKQPAFQANNMFQDSMDLSVFLLIEHNSFITW